MVNSADLVQEWAARPHVDEMNGSFDHRAWAQAHNQRNTLAREVQRLREYVEASLELSLWSAFAFAKEPEDLFDAAMRLGILVTVPHAQPCEVEECECDGTTELCQFAWRVNHG